MFNDEEIKVMKKYGIKPSKVLGDCKDRGYAELWWYSFNAPNEKDCDILDDALSKVTLYKQKNEKN